MGDIPALKHEALRLLDQRLVPGAQARELKASVERVGRILEELNLYGAAARPAIRTIEQRISSIETRIALALTDPEHIAQQPSFLKPGLESLLYDLGELHTRQSPAGYLLADQPRAEQAPGARHFAHIPYSYFEASPGEGVRALNALALKARPAKTYKVLPFQARGALWNLTLIGHDNLPAGADGRGITVGVVDTGIDYTHEALKGRFGENKGHDFIVDDDDPMDENGHGTHVAGTVAGAGIGVAQGATLYALRFLDADGYGSEIGFIRAAEWAIDQGLHILNGSFGSGRPSDAEEAVCDALRAHGIIFAAAAGNDGTWDYNYPASYASVLSVAAVDRNKNRAPFSQRNDQVALAAPGVDIHSSVPGGYDTYSGTSMATPHAAGSLAILRALHDDPSYARELLLESAEALGPAEEYGRGLVRIDQAVRIDGFRRRWAA